MNFYRLDVPPHVSQVIRHLPPDLKRRIKLALRAICQDPHLGILLRGTLAGFLKYPVKRFRIVYSINQSRRVIRILALGHRRGIYEEIEALRGGES